MSRNLISTLCVMAGLLVGGATAAHADTPIPEEWGGIWDIAFDIYDCDTNQLVFSAADRDTLCPGAVFEDPGDDEVTWECTSSADGDSYTSHCEGSTEMIPGCTATFTVDMTGTRTGDSYTATSIVATTYSGACFDLEDTCQRTESAGTRVGGTPDSCQGTPNENLTWGTMKSTFR